MADDQIQKAVAPPEHRVSPEADLDLERRVTCPRCLKATDSLKCFDVPTVIFLMFYVIWNCDRVVACPDCLRKFLLKRCLAAVVLTNVLFPLAAVVYLAQWIASYFKGHADPAMAEEHRRTRADVIANLHQVISLRKPPRKERVILGIILVLCGGLWLGGMIVKHNQDAARPLFEGKSMEEWIAQLQAPDPADRRRAIDILGKIEPRNIDAIRALQQQARDAGDWRVRLHAYRTLLNMGAVYVEGIPPPR